MQQRQALVKTLKRELKRRGHTYREVAALLQLSEASVKRLFAEGCFSLTRLDLLCNWLGMTISDLVRLMEHQARVTNRLALEQERELVTDVKLLLMAHFLINGVSYRDIIAQYDISELEGTRLLAKLDRMKLIELLPGNHVRVTISRQFEWLPNGPLQRFYEQKIQSDFLRSTFSAAGEKRVFLSGMLTPGSNAELARKLKQLATEFGELHQADQSEPLAQRFGSSLLIALRPWEPAVFASLRRSRNLKQFGSKT